MKLYFIRHGQSEANVQKIISNRGYTHGLTDLGFQQAQALTERFKDIKIERIFTSPLMRAVQTAEVLATSQGLEYTITDALREFDCGVYEGKSDADSWAQLNGVWVEWMEHGNFDQRLEGGECFHDIQARVTSLVDAVVAEYSDTDANIVFVAHGGTLRAALSQILTNVDITFAYKQGLLNTGVVVAEWKDNALTCLQWGEYSF